ncbi:MAG TPA: polysaccharide biosynthesis C-terminal domain-containing protein [Chitinophagaceae bacterium]|nr:polysaccharide biosynthesis C-terminal domain-containing protein [Chitinophagaceae bacterium]
MSGIKKLAGQTLWYGVPTITRRFLGYIMNLTLPLIFAQPSTTADLTQVYAIIPFLNVLFTYGLETAYFRFSRDHDQKEVYNTLSVSLIGSTVFFTVILLIFKDNIAQWANLDKHPEYITWMAAIIFFDAISTLAFARLRQENRPKRYAFATIAGVLLNILVVALFLAIIPKYVQDNPDTFLGTFYNKDIGIGYYLIGNLAGSILTFIILRKEFSQIHFSFNKALWKKVMQYAYPLIIVGMGGMVNDMLSRLIYQHVVDLPEEQAKHELGIFGNIYRLAVLITIMIQAFRMAAEPFFFNQSKEENAPRTYARIMKFFVIACCFMFLFISLYIDVFAWFFQAIDKPAWVEGLNIVPLLALGNIFLGVYYNLSIWYKLTNKNMTGAAITIGGAVITIVLNILLIPKLHYLGAAIATFCCYLMMMIASYILGQKHFPVPYARKKLMAYLVLVVIIYALHRGLTQAWENRWFNIGAATLLLGLFALFVAKIERKELERMPFIGRLFRPKAIG